ncbi:glycosyltransferase family 5 protein [Collybiopsis luxurians FD-317 M1]|uniref:Glycosyltransferase family 5 protein n=1 Tax=Collybiopsis luxurians FD-317 M1 TaxID=944289 RepID=A0A0D0CHT4_9AGAR|nr:glycosyltransferase family 5 protein [Collybiopsis luxurians FD-317 M1]
MALLAIGFALFFTSFNFSSHIIHASLFNDQLTVYNININKNTSDLMEYFTTCQNTTYNSSPDNQQALPIYTILLDKWVNGDPSNDDFFGTMYKSDVKETQLRLGGNLKGLVADSYSPLDISVLDPHCVGTMSNFIGFKDSSTSVHLLLSQKYKDFQVHLLDLSLVNQLTSEHSQICNTCNTSCLLPRFWNNNGTIVNVILPECPESDFDQYSDIKVFSVFPDWQCQLSKFASVQDRLREWKPSVMPKLTTYLCIMITALDIDAIRIDKVLQLNIWEFDILDYYYSNTDNDGVLDWLPPNTEALNYINMSTPPFPYLAWLILMDDSMLTLLTNQFVGIIPVHIRKGSFTLSETKKYWSEATLTAENIAHADWDYSGLPCCVHQFLARGVFNQWGNDRRIDSQFKFVLNLDAKWELKIMTSWPSDVQLNVNILDYYCSDMDSDGILDWLPPNTEAPNYVNMSADDLTLMWTLQPCGKTSISMVIYGLLVSILLITATLAVSVFMLTFYSIEHNKYGIVKLSYLPVFLLCKRSSLSMDLDMELALVDQKLTVHRETTEEVIGWLEKKPKQRMVLIAMLEYEIMDWNLKVKIGGLGVMLSSMDKAATDVDLIWVMPKVKDSDYPLGVPDDPTEVPSTHRPKAIHILLKWTA